MCRSGEIPGRLYGQRAWGRHPGSLAWCIKSRTAWRCPGVLVGNWRKNAKGTEIGSFPAEFPRQYEYLFFYIHSLHLYGFSKKLEAEP